MTPGQGLVVYITACSPVIPKLLPLVVSVDPRMRHGALHAVTQMTTALCSLKCSPVSAVLGENLVQQLVQLVPQVHKQVMVDRELKKFRLLSAGGSRGVQRSSW